MPVRKKKNMTEKELADYMKKNGAKSVHGLDEKTKLTLEALNIPAKFLVKEKKKPTDGLTPVKKQINKFKVIMATINECQPVFNIQKQNTELSLVLWFPSARVLTLNELFTTLQNRKYEIFQYKDLWKKVINNVVLSMGKNKPYFDGPTRIYLFRRGKRLIDLDSFQTIFKYIIDGLRYSGIIAEDNPNIVVEIIPIQEKGEPCIGIKLERLYHWENKQEKNIYQEWFNHEEPEIIKSE